MRISFSTGDADLIFEEMRARGLRECLLLATCREKYEDHTAVVEQAGRLQLKFNGTVLVAIKMPHGIWHNTPILLKPRENRSARAGRREQCFDENGTNPD